MIFSTHISFLLYFSLWNLISKIYSPEQYVSIFPTTNCYESFSTPKFIFNVSMYVPSGPDYMIVTFQTHIYITNPNKKYIKRNLKLYFKRMYMSCENSKFILTTKGYEISEMVIEIKFYLSELSNEIAHINYSFEKGFKNDNYTLIDLSGNFGMLVQVINSEENYKIIFSHLDEVRYYLKSLRNQNNRICVLNNNNKRVIIDTDYGYFDSQGYIVGISIQAEYSQNSVQQYEYDAFNCIFFTYYINLPIVFITEDTQMLSLSFTAIYVHFDDNNQQFLYKVPFEIAKKKIIPYTPKLIFPQKFNILFLIKDVKYYECDDGSKRIIYGSKNSINYDQSRISELDVGYKVKQRTYGIDLRWVPCEQ